MRFFPLFLASAVGAAVVGVHEQVLLVEHSLGQAGSGDRYTNKEETERPSVGVHFTSSNAVAAARYPNGTMVDMAKVKGDADYIDLMSRWLSSNSESPWNKKEDAWKPCSIHARRHASDRRHDTETCTLEAQRRQRQTNLDTSPNRDLAILSNILREVQILVETDLGIKLTTLAPVFFPLRNDQTKTVQDAMESVGLKSTHSDTFIRGDVLVDTTAAYAGTGALLCKDWMKHERCKSEHSAAHSKTVLFLAFDIHSFSASIQSIRSDTTSYAIGPQVSSIELGWWDLPVFEVPRAKFWAKVQEAIESIVGALGRETIDKIVLMGEHGADDEFKEVVEAVVWSALEIDVGPLLRVDEVEGSERIAARGAAEMAWRKEYWRRKADAYKAIHEAQS